MRLSEVLGQVEGLNKRFVYYLEAQGYIHPRKVRKERISRRDYSEEDVVRIRDVWAYYRRGFSVLAAEQMAQQAERLAAYVLLVVPAGRWQEALAVLTGNDRVQEVAFLYGETANAIVRVAAPDDQEIYAVLNEAFDRASVASVPRILKVQDGFRRERPTGDGKERQLQAYVLIKVPAKQAGGVLEELRKFAGVTEASVIYGETDIVARLSVADQDELDDLIINKIQDLPMVESTRTFLIVGRLQWRR
ncbi:MAG: Lrp/AsnC family transcriptional regulator [Chloroflexota bacterium]